MGFIELNIGCLKHKFFLSADDADYLKGFSKEWCLTKSPSGNARLSPLTLEVAQNIHFDWTYVRHVTIGYVA